MMKNEIEMKKNIVIFCRFIEEFLAESKSKILNDGTLGEDDLDRILVIGNYVDKEMSPLIETSEQAVAISDIIFILDMIGLAIANTRSNNKLFEGSKVDTVLFMLRRISEKIKTLLATYETAA